jgi:hypothetical protein
VEDVCLDLEWTFKLVDEIVGRFVEELIGRRCWEVSGPVIVLPCGFFWWLRLALLNQ